MNSAPVITASFAYHHILDDRKIDFLANLKKHLNSDGFLLMCENFLPEYATNLERVKAVRAYYGALEEYYRKGNATLDAMNVIKEVRRLEEDGIEEHKVSFAIFLKHLEFAGFDIKTDIQVWNAGISSDLKAGSHVIVWDTK